MYISRRSIILNNKNVLTYILFGKSAYFWKETGVRERCMKIQYKLKWAHFKQMTLWHYTIKCSLGGAWYPQNWPSIIQWPFHYLNPAVIPGHWSHHPHHPCSSLCLDHKSQTVTEPRVASPLEMGRAPQRLVRWPHPSGLQRHKANQERRLSAYVNADLLSSNMLSLASTHV